MSKLKCTAIEWKDLQIMAKIKDIVWDRSPHGYEFELYDIVGRDLDELDRPNLPLYEKTGTNDSFDVTDDLENAQPYLTGVIKWDGCSHFHFGREGYLHLCGIKEIGRLGKVLDKLINLAKTKGCEEI